MKAKQYLINRILNKKIPFSELVCKVGVTYYQLLHLWMFEKTNYFNEAKENFLSNGEKMHFNKVNKYKPYKDGNNENR